jgi:hypothetical protein
LVGEICATHPITTSLNRFSIISVRTVQAARLLIDRHFQREYQIVILTTAVVNIAENLFQKHPLRAYNALQLASALEANTIIRSVNLSPLTFVSADVHLLNVAIAEGLITDNPNQHP